MGVFKIVTSLLLTLLPIAVLIRDWKFHDRRTRRHHSITRAIIVLWCMGSITTPIFIWLDSAHIDELINGKNTLIVQNTELSQKLDDYQEDLSDKEQKIKDLEAKAQNAARGITKNYYANGSRRRTNGGTISLDGRLKSTFEQMKSLAQDRRHSELIGLCREQIEAEPDWPTPYLFLGVALANSGERHEAVKQLEHFVEIAPTLSSYGFEDFRKQALEFITVLKEADTGDAH